VHTLCIPDEERYEKAFLGTRVNPAGHGRMPDHHAALDAESATWHIVYPALGGRPFPL